MFAQSISDFNQKIISTEDFTSKYETIIEKIYTSKEMAIMSIDESCSKNIFNKLQNSYKQKIKEW